MKLTNCHRQAFVSAVLLDIPEVDYRAQFQKLIEEDMLVTAPPKIAAVLKDKELRHYLINGYSSFHPGGYYSALGGVSVYRDYKPSIPASLKIEELQALGKAQKESREAIEAQISGVIKSCTTLKSAQDRLPEFVKYLPEEDAKGTMLPAIANLAAELAKMGWPKGAKQAVAA